MRKFQKRSENFGRYSTSSDTSKLSPTETVEAWKILMHIASSRPAIALPEFGLPFQLHVDASVGQEHHDPTVKEGIGAILTQIQDGITRPVGYFSRQFGESERKHNAHNAELAGIVASLNHFYYYLKGSRTTIITDHLPKVKNSRRDHNIANALWMEMDEMDIVLTHIRGEGRPADALSRQSLPEDYPGIREARQAKTDIQLIKTTSAETQPIEQSKDAFGFNNYDQSDDGRLTRGYKGRPVCNYCGITNHPSYTCRTRRRDLEKGIIRQHHPDKGMQLAKTTSAEPRDAPIDQGQPQPPEQSKDAFGFNNYDQSDEGRLTRGYKGCLVCNYCGIANHPSSACRTRQKDLDRGVCRQHHPNKGNFRLHPRGRQDPQSNMVNATNRCVDTHSTPVTLTITDPEDAKWLKQAVSSGIDPAQVISMCRQKQQNLSRSQAANDPIPPTPKISASLLPSGLVACNECAHVSATFELSDRHLKETHPGLANGPDGRN